MESDVTFLMGNSISTENPDSTPGTDSKSTKTVTSVNRIVKIEQIITQQENEMSVGDKPFDKNDCQTIETKLEALGIPMDSRQLSVAVCSKNEDIRTRAVEQVAAKVRDNYVEESDKLTNPLKNLSKTDQNNSDVDKKS
jgi:hypothetical protein